jgi:hypothetical protein
VGDTESEHGAFRFLRYLQYRSTIIAGIPSAPRTLAVIGASVAQGLQASGLGMSSILQTNHD